MTGINPGPLNSQAPYLPPEFDIPAEGQSIQEWIALRERLTGSCLNIREIAIYETSTTQTGQQWFSVAATNQFQAKRYGFRQVYPFDTISAGSSLSIPHNITIPTTIPPTPEPILFFTEISATCITDFPDQRPIPYTSALDVTGQIGIRVDTGTASIVIFNGTTSANILSGVAVLEWLLY